MCGVAGLITEKQNVLAALARAQQVQQHRGPDSQGVCRHELPPWQVGLGHQRLAIIDLTPTGHQPMASEHGQEWLAYNGEVYNYREVRTELESLGLSFRGNSDTEVVLAALRYWGPEKALAKFNGMWAFAYLDKPNRRLILARDRVGVKPLYYFLKDNELYFASEIKTILEMVQKKFELNQRVAGEYLLQSLLDTSEETFFKDIQKVPAAHYGEIDLSAVVLSINWQRYWSLPRQNESPGSWENLLESVRHLFFDSVRLRLRSDVPLGVLLSGGLDSSSIAAVMQRILGKEANLNMLSAVTDDSRFDESVFIDAMGKHLGSPIYKVKLDFQPRQALNYLDEVCWFNDEPVGSFSNVAHYLLMKKSRELGITVILSGQGGDELLCGYKKYLGFYVQHLLTHWRCLTAVRVLHSFWDQGTVLNQFNWNSGKRYLPRYLRPRELDIRGPRLKDYTPTFLGIPREATVQQRQAMDVERFSIPILVHYEDRMSMAWAREIRVPFLDYRLIETLVSLPMEAKLNHGWTKYVLRRALEPFLPPEIVWRKDKQGFVNPQAEWLKHELRPLVMDFFSQDSLIFTGQWVHRRNLLEKYDQYCRQPVNKGSLAFRDIFNPLAMEVWLRRFSGYLA